MERYGSWQRMTGEEWPLPIMPRTKKQHQRSFRLVKRLNERQSKDPERAKDILPEILSEKSALPGLHVPPNLECDCAVMCGRRVVIDFGPTILAQAKGALGDGAMVDPKAKVNMLPEISIGKTCVVSTGTLKAAKVPDNSLVLRASGFQQSRRRFWSRQLDV